MHTCHLVPALLLALAPAAAGAQTPAPRTDPIAAAVDSLARDANGLTLPAADVRRGAQTVAAGQTITGSIAAWHGDLDVRGTVTGNAVAFGGNVILEPGSVVRGDALAVAGQVRDNGGSVGGEIRSLSGYSVGPVPAGPGRAAGPTTRRSISLSVGWYLVLGVIGLFVLAFARRNLETIAERIRDDFARAFWYGVLGQIALLPAFIVSIVVLCITIIGVVVVPFAIVAYVLGAAGALALGFLAMSYITGDAMMRWRGAAPLDGPTPVLQFLFIGLSLYLILWIVAGALTWAGLLGGIIRFIVGIITWVSVTVGFGAVLASRGGTRAPSRPAAPLGAPVEEYAWQTPTPVTGVAAARRPTPPATPSQPREP